MPNLSGQDAYESCYRAQISTNKNRQAKQVVFQVI